MKLELKNKKQDGDVFISNVVLFFLQTCVQGCVQVFNNVKSVWTFWRDQDRNRIVTCGPFPLWPPLAGLLHLGFLRLFPSFFFIVASSVFIFLLSEVIVFFITAKVICRIDTEGTEDLHCSVSPRGRTNALISSRKWMSLPAESFLDLESLSSDSSLQQRSRQDKVLSN